MNDSNFENNNEITMSVDEKRKHSTHFSKVCIIFTLFMMISQALSYTVAFFLNKTDPALLENATVNLILSSAVQYLVAFPILVLMLRKIPAKAPSPSKITAGKFFKYLLVSMFVMYVGNYISTMILSYMELYLGFTPINAISELLIGSNVIISIALVGIIGPIVEEMMFRKLFTDRLTPYGDGIAIVFPSLVFGLFHGNIYQFFYAFLLGMAFSYIYIKTGKIIYSTIIHIFINLFCGILPSVILTMFNYEEFLELTLAGTITEEYIMANALPITLLGIYEFLMLGMVFAGVFTLTRNIKNIKLNKGEVRFPKGTTAEILFFNPGTIALITICIILIAFNTFNI